MIATFTNPRARGATFADPRARSTSFTAPPIPYSTPGTGVEGQLINGETGALLFDDVTGAPLTW